MAIYTTLFAATLVELEERFPGVADPLPAPRTITRLNPFTKQPVEVEVFEPEFKLARHQRSIFEETGMPHLRPLIRQNDDYGRYLDSLVPARLRSVPHIGTKNVSFVEVADLMQLAPGPSEKYVNCLDGEGRVEVAPGQ